MSQTSPVPDQFPQ